MATSDCITVDKQCKSCGGCFPRTNQYWHKDKKSRDGLSYTCKKCACNKVAKWQQEHPERKRANQFRYRNLHAEELRVREQAKRRANPEHAYEVRRAWAVANPEKVREASRQYAAKKPDHVTVWASKNPHKAKSIKNRYRTNKKYVEGRHTSLELEALFDEQCGRCAYCGIRIDQGYQIEHLVPLSRGGTDFISNIRLTCSSCNQSKGGKMFDEWVAGRGW